MNAIKPIVRYCAHLQFKFRRSWARHCTTTKRCCLRNVSFLLFFIVVTSFLVVMYLFLSHHFISYSPGESLGVCGEWKSERNEYFCISHTTEEIWQDHNGWFIQRYTMHCAVHCDWMDFQSWNRMHSSSSSHSKANAPVRHRTIQMDIELALSMVCGNIISVARGIQWPPPLSLNTHYTFIWNQNQHSAQVLLVHRISVFFFFGYFLCGNFSSVL